MTTRFPFALRYHHLFAILLVLTTTHTNADQSDDFGLKTIIGSINQIRIEESWYESKANSWSEGERFLRGMINFNQHGNQTLQQFYAGENNPRERIEKKYNGSNELVSEIKFAASGQTIRKVTYAYKNNLLVEETDYRHFETPLITQQYFYDDHQRKITTRYFEKGELTSFTHYVFDSNGLLSYNSDHIAGGTQTVKTVYEYDEQQNPIKMLLFDGHNTLQAYWMQQFDDKNRLIEVTAYTIKRGQEMRKTYQYNDHDLLIEYTTYGRDDIFLNCDQYTYQFDQRGNWIEKHEWFSRPYITQRTPIRVIYRHILYTDKK